MKETNYGGISGCVEKKTGFFSSFRTVCEIFSATGVGLISFKPVKSVLGLAR